VILPDDSPLRIQALVRLEPAAISAFYREFVDDVFAFACFRLGGHRADAEDVTQETFMTALRSVGSFGGRSSLRTWLFGIARNKAHERLRERGRGQPLPDLEAVDLSEEVAQSEETAARVGAALAEIAPEYRRALEDKYVRGFSLAEIAQKRGRSVKATESLVVRARRAFVAALSETP
jgi:RNA polymerase sigma-70 factor (ECF subfamily)